VKSGLFLFHVSKCKIAHELLELKQDCGAESDLFFGNYGRTFYCMESGINELLLIALKCSIQSGKVKPPELFQSPTALLNTHKMQTEVLLQCSHHTVSCFSFPQKTLKNQDGK
jgi:hypothetical protein